jgi:hypothetical protein
LHTSGQNIYDSNGKQVKLYASHIFYGDANHISLSDIQKIKSMGFNAVRLHIYWGILQPSGPSSVNTLAFTQATEPLGASLDSIVSWCAQNGMYVILNPDWSPSFPAPSWADSLSSGTGLTSGDGGAAVNLLGNTQIQQGVYYLYNWMAQHYATNSNVIFESLNELVDQTSPAPASDRSAFASFNNGWVSAIESGEGANSHLKMVELLYDWSSVNYVLTGPFISTTHANIVLATHSYPFVDGTTAWALQCATAWSSAIHNAGYPWMDTEFSTAVGGGYGTPGLTYGVSLFNTYNSVGWTYFCYDSGASSQGNWNTNNPTNAASILPILQQQMIQP